MRFAQRKWRDLAHAEDVVHGVFEAVLSGRADFALRVALRAWLTAMRKRKILDLVQNVFNNCVTQMKSAEIDGFSGRSATPALNRSMRPAWATARLQRSPEPGSGPQEAAEQRQRQRVLLRIGALPPELREAMRRSVLEDRGTAAVCTALGISNDNLFVLCTARGSSGCTERRATRSCR